MKQIRLSHLARDVAHPAPESPAWASAVERWYQLDPPAFALAEAVSRWKPELDSRPSRIYLASLGASNSTDRGFAATGATSPTRFVHTLPNIRASSLLLVLGWHGPVFSLHRDPETLAVSLQEALEFAGERPEESAWVFYPELISELPETPVKTTFRVHLWRMGNLGTEQPTYLAAQAGNDKNFPNDHRIFHWFRSAPGDALSLGQGWQLRKRD